MPPNILLIMTDQQAANMLSCAGTPWVHTPALDTLAAEGVRFTHAVCANPVCVPSRTSMATGIMPCRLGACDNRSGMMQANLPPTVADHSLGWLMKRAGYATFYGGKVHMGPQLEPTRAGYDVYHPNEREALPDACIHFLRQKRTQPFFAVASFVNPHDICYAHNAKVSREPQLTSVTELYQQAIELDDDQLPPLPRNFELPDHEPKGYAIRRETRAVTPTGTMYETYNERDWRIYRWIYARLTEQVDTAIGRILAAVKATGLERNTVVIFTSDHGNMHGNHRLASKMAFYEESVGVPFLVKHPGHISPGKVNDTHLANIGLDLLPTCCDYAGIDPPDGLFGVSQRGAAEDRADAPAHEYVVSENVNGRMLRTRRWKYTVYEGDTGREILTDLEREPMEMVNEALLPDRASHLRQYRAQLREWFEKTGDTEGLQRFAVDSRPASRQ